MQKIISFSLDDLAADTAGVQDAVNTACARRGVKYRVRGLCQIESQVYFALLPKAPEEESETYVLAPLDPAPSHQDATAIFSDRWGAGFDLVGSIKVYETLFLLFARRSEPNRQGK